LSEGNWIVKREDEDEKIQNGGNSKVFQRTQEVEEDYNLIFLYFYMYMYL